MKLMNRILTPERTLCNASGSSKKRVLESISDFINDTIPDIDGEQLFEHLIAREKLGSTGIGKGIAIPHCRCSNITETFGCLVKLNEAIDFDSIDNLPVDILFVLMVPEDAQDQHLQVLAQLAELFNQTEFRNGLRKSQDEDELYQAATQFEKVA